MAVTWSNGVTQQATGIVDALPLTAPGKVQQLSLRADATVRLPGITLAALAPRSSFEIDERDGGKHGLEVVVTMSGMCRGLAECRTEAVPV